jgi:hypothetical protein
MKKILLGLAASLALAGSLFANDITLVWTPSPDVGVTGYKIYYGPSTGALTNIWGVGLTNVATITGLTSATNLIYGFTVVATNATTESAPTLQIQTVIPPHSVKNPRLVGVTPNGFTFTWQPSDEADAKTYKVTYGTVSPMTTNTVTVAAPAVTVVITNNVVANVNHYFDFTVLNNAGVESWPKTQLRAVLLPAGPPDVRVTVQVQ